METAGIIIFVSRLIVKDIILVVILNVRLAILNDFKNFLLRLQNRLPELPINDSGLLALVANLLRQTIAGY